MNTYSERIKALEAELAELKAAETREYARVRHHIIDWVTNGDGEDELTSGGESAVDAIMSDIPGLVDALRSAGVLPQ